MVAEYGDTNGDGMDGRGREDDGRRIMAIRSFGTELLAILMTVAHTDYVPSGRRPERDFLFRALDFGDFGVRGNWFARSKRTDDRRPQLDSCKVLGRCREWQG